MKCLDDHDKAHLVKISLNKVIIFLSREFMDKASAPI